MSVQWPEAQRYLALYNEASMVRFLGWLRLPLWRVISIDQPDKADAPQYIYLLAGHATAFLCEGSAGLYDSLVVRSPRAPGDALIRAPPVLDLPSLPPEEESTKHLYMVRDIIERGWPALLAALCFIIGINLMNSSWKCPRATKPWSTLLGCWALQPRETRFSRVLQSRQFHRASCPAPNKVISRFVPEVQEQHRSIHGRDDGGITAGIFDSYQDEARLPSVIQVWQRSPTMEGSYRIFPSYCEGFRGTQRFLMSG